MDSRPRLVRANLTALMASFSRTPTDQHDAVRVLTEAFETIPALVAELRLLRELEYEARADHMPYDGVRDALAKIDRKLARAER